MFGKYWPPGGAREALIWSVAIRETMNTEPDRRRLWTLYPSSPDQPAVPHLLSWLAFAMIIAVAAFLRFQQLPEQWLTDDEWHAVHQVVSGASYGDLASMVYHADFSIPQAIFYKFLAEHGGLDEVGMRLPMVLAGLLLVGGGAWWTWRNFGATAGWCFGLLLAISPLLVNFSRTARPYAITLPLAWLALFALLQWREQRRIRDAACFAVSAIFACWLHMAVAPFILAPFAWAALADLGQGWRDRNWLGFTKTLMMGTVIALSLGALSLRPMLLNQAELASRVGKNLPTLDTYLGVWHTWLGTSSSAVVVLGLALAVPGAVILYRRKRRLVNMALLGLLATLASIYVSRPAWVQNALTFGRYLLPAQPLLLLCVALGLAQILDRLREKPLRVACAACAPAIFLIGTPYSDILHRPNNFTLSYWFQFDYRKSHNPVRARFKRRPVHPFWQRFSELPPGSVRFAVSGHGLESFTIPDVRWQLRHHQLVFNAQLGGYCGPQSYYGEALPETGIRLRNAVTLAEPETLAAKHIDYVVFDRKGSTDVEACIKRFREEHGAPEVEDDELVIFHLMRAHARK